MIDTAGYSDIIFGLLGYRFSPRLADIEGTKLWRFDPNAGYIVNLDDIKRPSPLGYDHINIAWHYSFDLAKEILSGKLRPLKPMDKNLFGNK
ncbi:Tn3 family transposase [Clostridium tagluense]|nr:Tn3 family transposase [Clostridium tagluense]